VLIGSRGMGKTSLLRRIAIGVGDDADLGATFAPLRFREEQYNVISPDAFWRNCGEALAEWLEAAGRDAEADRLDRAMERPEWRDAERAADVFLAACAATGRRPLLLVDNLDLILDALKEPETWKLREVLQRPGGPVVIGAATQHLQQASDRTAPFYEFFHPHVLEPLSEKELLACMDALAVRRGAAGQPVRAILSRQPERIRTLYALTGGNPRVLALIYQVLERSETDTIFADLEALLDQVTPFYKARVEEYSSPQQRAVIDAIALNWDPIGSGALAEATGIEVTTISSHLSRLRRSGFVEEVQSSGARSGYQLAERFLNIWYLMRHGTRRTRHRLRWLTLFLARLYSSEELGRMALEADGADAPRRWHPHFRAAFDEARRVVALWGIGGAPGDFDIAAPSGQGGIDPEIVALFDMGVEHIEAGRFEQAVAAYREIVGRGGSSSEPVVRVIVAKALVNKGFCLGALGRSEESIAVYGDVVSRFAASPEPALHVAVARALVNKGLRLGSLGRSQEAVAGYDDVVARFVASPNFALREQVARALALKGNHLFDDFGELPEAEAAYRRALEFDGGSALARGNLAWVLLAKGEAEAARVVVGGLDGIPEPGLRLLTAGIELVSGNLGNAFAGLGKVLDEGLEDDTWSFFDDLMRFLRIAAARGHGEAAIAWFEASGHADRSAPVHAALVAVVRGEAFLNDVNPEMRPAARQLFERLSRPGRATPPPPAPKARRRSSRKGR
jgi:tetratricopeptide (TPR) repeat protein